MSSSQVAIVTGAAMGYQSGGPSIGGANALRLAKDGFVVVVVDEGEMGARTVELIREQGGEATFMRADVATTTGVKQIVEQTQQRYGRLDCLVNGVSRYSPGMAKSVAEIDEAEWDKTMLVNLGSYFKMCKYCIPLMLKSEQATIINISSIGAFNALPDFAVYSVSKAAINALTHSLAVDFAPRIRANAICPGFVRIANSENGRTPAELTIWYADIAKQYPMQRVCEVEEIANVVSFLASPESSFINGQSLVVDGGKLVSDRHEF